MANYIRVPILESNITSASGPRYGVVNVEDVYDVAGSDFMNEIFLYTSMPAAGGEVEYISVLYLGEADIVTNQDLENLRNLILSANQNPGSNPIFNLIGEATGSTDYLVVSVGVGSTNPI